MSFAKRARYIGTRLLAIYRSQGWLGLFAFVGTRVFQRREDLLYEIHLDDRSADRSGDEFESVVVVDREQNDRVSESNDYETRSEEEHR